MIVLKYLSAFVYGLLCILIAFIAGRMGMDKKYTRKIVHILVGFEWVILYSFFGAGFHFTAVCIAFTLFLILTYKSKYMDMMSSGEENAPGTVYYGISMTVMAIISCFAENFIFAFGIAVFCTSLGDGLAGVVGAAAKSHNPRIYKSKTLFGTLSAFLFSFISIVVFVAVYSLNIKIYHALASAALAAGLELITGFGLDNITLPIGVSLFAYLLIFSGNADAYIIPIILTPFVVAIVSEKRILSQKGIIAALICDLLITVSLADSGFLLMLAFLLLSVVVDKVKNHARKSSESVEQKQGTRDGMQVLANGIIPVIMALLYLFTNSFVFVVAYCAALGEAFSDTCASGFGSLSGSSYDILRRREIPIGLSGGVSIIGTVASFAAPFVLLSIPLAFDMIELKVWAMCSVSSFLGSVFDSVLGSLVQVKFKCKVCGAITEKRLHCSAETEYLSGIACIDNDAVNLISTLFSAVLSIAFYLLIQAV